MSTRFHIPLKIQYTSTTLGEFEHITVYSQWHEKGSSLCALLCQQSVWELLRSSQCVLLWTKLLRLQSDTSYLITSISKVPSDMMMTHLIGLKSVPDSISNCKNWGESNMLWNNFYTFLLSPSFLEVRNISVALRKGPGSPLSGLKILSSKLNSVMSWL